LLLAGAYPERRQGLAADTRIKPTPEILIGASRPLNRPGGAGAARRRGLDRPTKDREIAEA